MGKVILLTGAPATGKTTLAKLMEKTFYIRRVDFGSLLLDLKKERGVKGITYAHLREQSSRLVSAQEVSYLDVVLIEKIEKWKKHTNVVIDSHAVTKEFFGFRSTHFSFDNLKRLRLDAILVLYCNPEELIRRIGDNPEGRPLLNKEAIYRHMYLQESLALIYGVATGCPVYFLDTTDVMPSELLNRVTRILEDIRINRRDENEKFS